jgi:hypothetical protein
LRTRVSCAELCEDGHERRRRRLGGPATERRILERRFGKMDGSRRRIFCDPPPRFRDSTGPLLAVEGALIHGPSGIKGLHRTGGVVGMSRRDAWWVAAIVAAMRLAFDSQRWSDWALLGVFCGFAFGTKYTGLLAVPILIFCAIAMRAREKTGWGNLARNAVAAIAAGGVIARLIVCEIG